MTGSGVLEIDVTNSSDVATLQDSGGQVSIRDSGNANIDIDVDGGGPMAVAWSDVKEVIVLGDPATDQSVVFDTQLSLTGRLEVDSEIETTVLTDSVNAGASISFGSNVVLENDVILVGTDVIFGGTLDSQPNATRRLTINAGPGSVSFNGSIGANVPLQGLDIQRADNGVTFGDLSAVHVVSSTDTIVIGSSSAIGGTGIVFNGGNNAALQIFTTNDDVTVNGATELRALCRFIREARVAMSPLRVPRQLTARRAKQMLLRSTLARAPCSSTATSVTTIRLANWWSHALWEASPSAMRLL